MIKYNTGVDTKSFYIHWPFCPYKCHFCPFVAIASHDEYMQDYHNSLKKEITDFISQNSSEIALDTIYFGGGTPSTYPTDLLLDTFDRLRRGCTFADNIEISIEINPGTVSQEKLVAWKNLGINRLSLGVQSLNNRVLSDLNRHQSKDDVLNFLYMASPLFKNISVDLIIGLPGISAAEWKDLINQVVNWPIAHISIYFLTVHENTPLFFRVKKSSIKLPNEDEVIDLFLWTIDYLKSFGFEQYETSSFARPGFESVHNQVYWQHKPYKGFGMGACSFDGASRLQNEKNLMEYLNKVNTGQDLSIFSEQLNPDKLRLEKIMLGLRQTKKGILIEDLFENLPSKKLSGEKLDLLKTCLNDLESRGLINRLNGRISLTPKGVILENEIVVKLAN